jgi:Tetratricopeptide Repeats-Sensor
LCNRDCCRAVRQGLDEEEGMPETKAVGEARRFLANEDLTFAQANALWEQLKREDQLPLARRVLERMRKKPACISDPKDKAVNNFLCQQEALLTSKDPELNAATRHDKALELLDRRFNLATLAGDQETLGIAGGICKRRWNDLGQLKDLVQAADFYERGAQGPLGNDAYPHINAAFLDDLLAAAGDRPDERHKRAKELRERILRELEVSDDWFNLRRALRRCSDWVTIAKQPKR